MDKQIQKAEKEARKAEEKANKQRRIIKNIIPGKVAGNLDSVVKKNEEAENPIRNELLGGLFDIDDDSNDENDDE